MARGDVEFLRDGYAALARGDLETFTALARERLAPDFEFHLVWDGRVLYLARGSAGRRRGHGRLTPRVG
jgi:ketosteroid isomerase-like protein